MHHLAYFNTPGFHLLQAFPAVNTTSGLACWGELIKDEGVVTQYQDREWPRFSKIYQQLIESVENCLERPLRELLGRKYLDWVDYKQYLKKNPAIGHFNMVLSYKEWVAHEKILPQKIVGFYELLSKRERAVIECINRFYSHFHLVNPADRFKIEKTQLAASLPIYFSSDQDYGGEDAYLQNCHYNIFICDDEICHFLNRKAKKANIVIRGEIKDLQRITVLPGAWYTEDFLKLFLENPTNNLFRELGNYESQRIHNQVKAWTSVLYIFHGLELEIKLDANFPEHERFFLRTADYSVFPFYLSPGITKKKLIEREDGALSLLIKNSSGSAILLGAEKEFT
jgi:hypothetical protein